MAGQGTATIDLGAFAVGKVDGSFAITGQTAIVAGSQVGAWLRLEATADHPLDDMVNDPPNVSAGNIVAGTGFTVYLSMPRGNIVGLYKVDWAWS